MTIVPQSPKKVKIDWEYFANAINSVARKTKEQFTPEQVYKAALNGDANIFHVIENGAKRGILVLTDHIDMYTGKTVLHVDMVYLTGPSLIAGMTEILNIIASKYEFDQIEFRSPRKGWFKYLSRAGFKAGAVFTRRI
jgi:hypoxanthine phosphoribosyltransferase